MDYRVKEKMVTLSGACFWYWNDFHSFLISSGVPRSLIDRYPKEAFTKYDVMRNILNDLDNYGKSDVIDRIISNFYKLKHPINRDNLDVQKAVNLLREFRELVGDDPIEAEIRQKEKLKARASREESLQANQAKQNNLNDLNKKFQALTSDGKISPQQRGYALERLFFNMLEHFEFEFQKPYRNPNEQIDGHFRYEKFDYLVEMKWTNSPTKQSDLAIFDGKIRGKAQSTRGLFLSASSFDANAISKFSGDSPHILLMTGQDLAFVLEGRITFDDAMRAKVDAIVRKGKILLELHRLF